MISEQHIYVGFDVGSAGPLAVGLLKLERQGIFESEEFVDGKNYLQDERAIAIHPEIFPLRKEPFQLSQKRLRDGLQGMEQVFINGFTRFLGAEECERRY